MPSHLLVVYLARIISILTSTSHLNEMEIHESDPAGKRTATYIVSAESEKDGKLTTTDVDDDDGGKTTIGTGKGTERVYVLVCRVFCLYSLLFNSCIRVFRFLRVWTKFVYGGMALSDMFLLSLASVRVNKCAICTTCMLLGVFRVVYLAGIYGTFAPVWGH